MWFLSKEKQLECAHVLVCQTEVECYVTAEETEKYHLKTICNLIYLTKESDWHQVSCSFQV